MWLDPGGESMQEAPILSQGDNASRRPMDEEPTPTRSQQAIIQAHSKCLRDPVHDNITLHPLLIAIIDTPQFQRLRSVQQLGCVSSLFPGAVHTRFEHSVGTSHLSTKMVLHLKTLHPEISEADVLCVGMAGLCHDLGHGPYSHLFEHYVNDQRRRMKKPEWHHETTSIKMFRYLMEVNEIDHELYNLSDSDLNFVQKLICGLKTSESWPTDIGRDESKRYLFDIVSNKRNGIDMDKLDYFLRDSLHCYGRLPVDINVDRIIHSCRAIFCEGQMQLCYEEKVALSLQDVFRLRVQLHKYIYQHRVTLIIQQMMLDILMAVGDKFTVCGMPLYDVMENLAVYTKVGDWIFNAIAATDAPELQRARDIHDRLLKRNLYKVVQHVVVKPGGPRPTVAGLLTFLPPHISMENFFVATAAIKFASEVNERNELEDPLNHVRFFNPKERQMDRPHPILMKQLGGLFSPSVLEEHTVFVCSRSNDGDTIRTIYAAYESWKKGVKEKGDFVEARGNINSPPPPDAKLESSSNVRKRLRLDVASVSTDPVDVSPMRPPHGIG